MPLPWMIALKEFNSGKGEWCVPKKGSDAYAQVKRIQNRTTPEETEKRNVERRAKAAEQLKAVDTRAKISARRTKEAEAKALALPAGAPSLSKLNAWGRTQTNYGGRPYSMKSGASVFVKFVERPDLGRFEMVMSPYPDFPGGSTETAKLTPAEMATEINKIKRMASWRDLTNSSSWFRGQK